jgi:mRNA-degrading endonuclease RelE of RelBE toxin-antitoxin system
MGLASIQMISSNFSRNIMDKIEKFIKKLSKGDAALLAQLMLQIRKDCRQMPNAIALQGFHNLFRVRVGNYRVIYEEKKDGKGLIIKIARRNEKTYKRL